VKVADWVPAGVDINAASPARVHDYHLGGLHNFPADRWVAQRAAENVPDLLAAVRANRAFLQRAVRYLCSAGVQQFLDLGSGIPTEGNVHEVAHAVDPTARVVYVDMDPVAAAHGKALLAGIYSAAMVRADLCDVRAVLASPDVRNIIDFSQPVAVLMVSVLHLLSDPNDPAGVIAHYRDAMPTGSHLVLSYPGRHRAGRIGAWFAGWELVEPGVTTVGQWRADERDIALPGNDGVADLGGVARKP
jgi:hypothetical protein